jgi:hypothetical protein
VVRSPCPEIQPWRASANLTASLLIAALSERVVTVTVGDQVAPPSRVLLKRSSNLVRPGVPTAHRSRGLAKAIEERVSGAIEAGGVGLGAMETDVVTLGLVVP